MNVPFSSRSRFLRLAHSRASERGFALIATLAIIALIIVLMIAIAATINVETRSSASTKQMLEARQNALLGLQVAMGQLQKYAGKDQAATFPATTYFPTKDVTAGTGDLYDGGDGFPGFRSLAQASSERSYLDRVETYLTPDERATWETEIRDWWNNGGDSRNPHWVGVVDTSLRVDRFTNPDNPADLPAQVYEEDPDTVFGEPKRDQIPVWLVSGNERFLVDQQDGTITDASGADASASYLTPETPLPNPNVDDSVVWLVGEGSATDATSSVDGLDGRVKAFKQEITKLDASGAVAAEGGQDLLYGHYAYWVGDESLKANFAVQDPFAEEDLTPRPGMEEGTVEYRNRLQSPQRIGWENITGFTGVATFEPNDDRLLAINTPQEISLLEDSATDAIQAATREAFHSLTAYSSGLQTDMALGGLKKDLTYYLQNGDVTGQLVGTDPIADPARYDPADARFRAYRGNQPTFAIAGDNTGFPTANAGALDNIPTWSELKFWYDNDSDVNQPITPNADTAPVLTYLMFHAGLSYEPSSQTLRWHWVPCFGIWNPYDRPLASATYELEIGLTGSFDNFYIANLDTRGGDYYEGENLSTLQQDSDPEWTVLPIVGAAGDPLEYGGKPVYRYVGRTASNRGGAAVDEALWEPFEIEAGDIGRQVLIFRGTHNNLRGVAASGDPDEWFVRIPESEADRVPMNYGPYPVMAADEAVARNGRSDAYGTYYYFWEIAGNTLHSEARTPSTTGGTGGTPSDGGGTPLRRGPLNASSNNNNNNFPSGLATNPDTQLPVDYPLRFTFTSGFGAGETLLFTLAQKTEMDRTATGASATLVNRFDPDFPHSLWFDLATLPDGPGANAGVRWNANAGNETRANPTFRFSIGGDLISESSVGLGDNRSNDLGGAITGKSYHDHVGVGQTQSGKQDDDNDGATNDGEANPIYVTDWRTLYDFGTATGGPGSDFEDAYQTGVVGTGNSAASAQYALDSSIWGYGRTWIAPFTGGGGYGHGDHLNYQSAFSRFNLGATNLDLHPLIDYKRSPFMGNNNTYLDVPEGMAKMKYVQAQEGTSDRWDDNQYDGDNGYSLISYRFADAGDPDANNAALEYFGVRSLPIRNARRAGSEVLSLGQFQQVNLSNFYWQPTFPIGNSDAPPYTDREAIAGINSRPIGIGRVGGNWTSQLGQLQQNNAPFTDALSGLEIPGNIYMDLSYLLNESLWDSYFLSTIPQTGTLDLTGSTPLSNSRHRLRTDLNASESDVRSFENAAAYLYNAGAFNVNSTSVEAWKALLTAFRDLEIESQAGESNPTSGNGGDPTVPISRSLSPFGNPIEFTDLSRTETDYGATANPKNYEQVVNGFRYLTDGMIQTLAERIVDEVRLRGPFYSLADFVNRRLVAPEGSNDGGTSHASGSWWWQARTFGYEGGVHRGGNNFDFMNPAYDPFIGLQGLNGTLQRALNVSGINGGVNHPALYDGTPVNDLRLDKVFSVRLKSGGDSIYVNNNNAHYNTGNGVASNSSTKHTIDPSKRSHLDTEHLAGAPVGEAGQLLAGAPGFVTQGDLLAMFGAALTARGDTFRIRTYGDVVNPRTGEVEARAWLEAVVQRVPEPVAPNGTTGSAQWEPEFGTEAGKLGRKFEIVSMRWLNPDEV